MNHIFDPLNIIILAIAVVIFWRLGSVLGRRTGNERPPFDPIARRDTFEKTAAQPLPEPARATEALAGREADAPPGSGAPLPPAWEGLAPKGSAVAKGLEKIAGADRQFRGAAFLEGAKLAYESIVVAFAKGDKQTLKPLLARDVLDGFLKDIDRRKQAGEILDTDFVGINKAEIVTADLSGRKATVTVRFQSQMITVTRNAAGDVLSGDTNKIREVTDVWTFERDVQSKDPNWTLVATEAPR
jgi:predicted lipid-binding transport protein (Tim44 family)